ncbi:unnamed protein product [Adineta steineri]|uniref:Annexin n=1 Tax=Adineta steineri TaxID=433720 RepID=A0A814NXI9_9BILA|nr:unnamed protein product [Adineta steineri]
MIRNFKFYCEEIVGGGAGTRSIFLMTTEVSRNVDMIDVAQIKQRYQQMYNRSLAHDVAGDTSGDYERVLLSILK